jgi:hypothetical protein
MPFAGAFMRRWVRIFAGLGMAIVAITVYSYFFGVQTAFGLMWRYKCRNIAVAWETPAPLQDLAISPTPHRRVSQCGYELELPWDDVDPERSRAAGPIHVTAFQSGNAFWFSCFPPKDFVNEVMKGTKLDGDSFRRVYGDAAFESDYGFYRAMLAVTPESITLLTPAPQVARDSTLLLTKTIALPSTNSGIFLVQTPDFKGFQFGAPRAHPFRITDELWAQDGGIELMFLQGQHSTAPAIAQPEINRVLRSVKKVADGRAAVKKSVPPSDQKLPG